MKKLIGILFLLPTILYAQTDIWVEDFTYADGTTAVTTGPTQWYTDVQGANFVNGNDYFEVRNNLLEARDVNGFVLWISEDIDISDPSYDNVSISFILSETTRQETDDYVRAYYSLDGADSVLFAESIGNIPGGGPITLATGGLTGSTLRITIEVANNGANERFRIDDVGVRQVGALESFASGDWDDGNNWSADGGTSACGCTPNAFTEITINSSETIDYNIADGQVNAITANGDLQWANGGGTLIVFGDINITTGASIDRNGFAAAIMELNGNLIVTISDATIGLDVEDLYSSGSGGTMTFAGAGRLNVNNDFFYEGGSHQIVNSMTGTFQVTNDFRFRPNFSGNTFTNNGPMNIGGDVRFNDDNCSLINNGTLTITDDLSVINNTDVNNTFTNALGATTSLNEFRLGNAPGITITNAGTLNQSGRFRGVNASNTVTNQTAGTWNYAGNGLDADLNLFSSASFSQFNYNLAGNQSMIVPQAGYYNLSIIGSGTKTIAADLDVNGNLSVGATLSTTTNDINLAGNLSNTGTISLTGTFTFDGGNQSINSGSSSLSDVVIVGTLTKTLAADLITNNLTISSTLDVSASDFAINVAGNFSNSGTFSAQSGRVVLDGTAAQSIAGVTTFNALKINKTAGTTAVNGTANIAGELDIQSASVLDADGSGAGVMTILSSASGDGRIAPITGGGSITGNMTVQRYLPNTTAARAWRYVASSVGGAFVSDWKNEVPITGTFNDPSTPAEWPGISGIASGSPSMYRYDEAAIGDLNARWESYPLAGTNSTAAPLETGRGYALYVRSTGTETLDVRGTATTGAVPVNVTAQGVTLDDGWNLISNPYPSAIDWNNVAIPVGVNDEIHFLDNVNNGGTGAGNFIRYVGGVGTPPSYAGEIAMGQAYWVRATANSTITFQEDDKTTGSPTFFKTAPLNDILRVKIVGAEGYDEMVIRFDPEATDGFDKPFDAGQRNFFYHSISTVLEDGSFVAINTLNNEFCEKSIPVVLLGTAPGDYALDFYNLESFEDISIRLVDQLDGEMYQISTDQVINFSVTSDSTSFFDRFVLEFSRSPVSNATIQHTAQVCEENALVTIGNATLDRTYEFYLGESLLTSQVAGDSLVQVEVSYEDLLDGPNHFEVREIITGCAQEITLTPFTITKNALPETPTAFADAVCFEGYVLLSVNEVAQAYRWYADLSSAEPLVTTDDSKWETDFLTESTSYFVSMVNSAGCESSRVEVVAEIITQPTPAITMDNGFLQSSLENGNQWFINGNPIEGEISQTLGLTSDGDYFVQNDHRGCVTESTIYTHLVAAIDKVFSEEITIFPNPVGNELRMELSSEIQHIKYMEVIDIQGRKYMELDNPLRSNLTMKVDHLAPGMYLLKLDSEKKQYIQRFYKN